MIFVSKFQGNFKLTVRVQDRPGELIKILEPLSLNGANVHGVFHEHDLSGNKSVRPVPVEVLFTLSNALSEKDKKEKINKIKTQLQEGDIEIITLSMEPVIRKRHVIMIGHVFDSDVRDTIMQLAGTGAKVVDLNGAITSTASESTVMFTMTYDSDEIEKALMEKVNSICKEKDLKFITS